MEHPLIELPKFGNIDLSVTNEVLMLWIAAAATLLLFIAAAQKLTKSAVATSRFTSLIETGVEFVQKNVAEEFLGHHAGKWAVFFAALFFFLLFSNLIGKVPGPIFKGGAGPHFFIE